MFRKAYEKAAKFTLPVVLSRKSVGGQCSSQIGSCTVINDEGWVLTCFHITQAMQRMAQESALVKSVRAQIAAIRADTALRAQQRTMNIAALPKITPDMTEECSAWWGRDMAQLVGARGIEAIDLAVGKLEPFDPKWVEEYPLIKDPAKNFEQGAALCKLGFPFHRIEPTWDPAARAFRLPPGALPLPRFPIEGIFTRIVDVVVANAPPPPFPLRWVETSSPGLKGQSGGPTFDQNGWIWAIQARVLPIPLGFEGEIEINKVKQRVPQFLNVGLGVHPTTIVGLLDDMKVKYQLSPH
jgi:hypothetical protein